MRLDARHGQTGWKIYDAESMGIIQRVVWLDDKTAQYAQYVDGMRTGLDEFDLTVTQAREIRIHPPQMLVVINPLPDTERDYDAAQYREHTT